MNITPSLVAIVACACLEVAAQTLQRAEPVILERGLNHRVVQNESGGTYTVNCATPVVRGCIEADQTITATSIPSDSYTIRVRGLITGKQCWLNMDSIQVPPLNKLLIRTLNLAQQTQTPGC